MPNRLVLGIAKIGDLLLNNHITQAEDDQDIYDEFSLRFVEECNKIIS